MKKIKIGDLVEVPAPQQDDIWNYSFAGTVRYLKKGIATVIDQNDDAFDIEVERLEIIDSF